MPSDLKAALASFGFSQDTGEQFVEMSEAFNSGLITRSKERTSSTKTSTDIREFLEAFRA